MRPFSNSNPLPLFRNARTPAPSANATDTVHTNITGVLSQIETSTPPQPAIQQRKSHRMHQPSDGQHLINSMFAPYLLQRSNSDLTQVSLRDEIDVLSRKSIANPLQRSSSDLTLADQISQSDDITLPVDNRTSRQRTSQISHETANAGNTLFARPPLVRSHRATVITRNDTDLSGLQNLRMTAKSFRHYPEISAATSNTAITIPAPHPATGQEDTRQEGAQPLAPAETNLKDLRYILHADYQQTLNALIGELNTGWHQTSADQIKALRITLINDLENLHANHVPVSENEYQLHNETVQSAAILESVLILRETVTLAKNELIQVLEQSSPDTDTLKETQRLLKISQREFAQARVSQARSPTLDAETAEIMSLLTRSATLLSYQETFKHLQSTLKNCSESPSAEQLASLQSDLTQLADQQTQLISQGRTPTSRQQKVHQDLINATHTVLQHASSKSEYQKALNALRDQLQTDLHQNSAQQIQALRSALIDGLENLHANQVPVSEDELELYNKTIQAATNLENVLILRETVTLAKNKLIQVIEQSSPNTDTLQQTQALLRTSQRDFARALNSQDNTTVLNALNQDPQTAEVMSLLNQSKALLRYQITFQDLQAALENWGDFPTDEQLASLRSSLTQLDNQKTQLTEQGRPLTDLEQQALTRLIDTTHALINANQKRDLDTWLNEFPTRTTELKTFLQNTSLQEWKLFDTTLDASKNRGPVTAQHRSFSEKFLALARTSDRSVTSWIRKNILLSLSTDHCPESQSEKFKNGSQLIQNLLKKTHNISFGSG
jgi:hypothetical protein